MTELDPSWAEIIATARQEDNPAPKKTGRPKPVCGTRSALVRHNRLGEIADAACLAADAAYHRERYAKKKKARK